MTGNKLDCPVLTAGQVDGSILGQYYAQLETRLIYADFFCDDSDGSILLRSL